jgi:hypothetical protein
MMQETVPLPDPAVQPLVHPDDVPQARELWRRAWLLSLAGSGCALFLLGSVMWAATGTWSAPTFGVLTTGAVAWFGHHRLARAAWDHIPQRRQDRDRPETPHRHALSHLVDALALTGGAMILVLWSAQAQQPRGVQDYLVGAGVALVVLVAGRTARLVRTRHVTHDARVTSALVLVVAALSLIAAAVWFTSGGASGSVAMLCGALTPLVVAGALWVWPRRSGATA